MRSTSPETRMAEIVSRRSTAIGWRRAMVRMALLLDLPLEDVKAAVGGDHALRQGLSPRTQRRDGVDEHLLGDAAHLGDAAAQILQFVVVGTDDVFRHGRLRCGRSGQPKRPVM